MNQHDIITEDGIEILIKETDEEHARYIASSDHPQFAEIFGSKSLDIHDDGENLEDYVLSNVEHRHQDQAFKIVKEILSAI